MKRARLDIWEAICSGRISVLNCMRIMVGAPTSAARKRHYSNRLEGKKGQPRFKPPFPASYGLYGKPTTINNTETFAAVPWLIRNGGNAFLRSGPAEQRRDQDFFGVGRC